MAIIGFSFNKFDCEKKEAPKGGVEISHSLKVDNIKKTPLNVGKSDGTEVLKVEFSFNILYGKSAGKIFMSGDLLYSDTPEILDETLKMWESDKKLATQISEEIHKFIYNKAIIRALELSDSLGLPAPVPLPKVNVKGKGDKSSGGSENKS